MTLTRAKLESLVMDLIERTAEPCRQAMKDAGITAKQIDEVILVGGQTRMPKVQELVRDLFGREPHKGVNPDEVVAVGAAVQAAVLAGEVKDVVLLDVTPLSLGIETLGGVMTRLIERNTTIPTKKSEVFITAADSQTSVEVHVLQGERPMARDNRTLGKFHLVGIPPAPRGVPQVEVTFDIDANGILNVSAKDRATGKEQAITITASSGLTKDDIDKMVRDSETNAEEDKQRREEIEVTNQADSLAYSIERQLAEHGDKVPAADKAAIEEAIKEVREALEAKDVQRVKQASEALTKASHKMAEALYRDAQAKTPGAGAGSAPAATMATGGPRRPRARSWTPSSRISGRRTSANRRARTGNRSVRKRDYYEVLGVSREAPVSEIRRAYRRLARRYSRTSTCGTDGPRGCSQRSRRPTAWSGTRPHGPSTTGWGIRPSSRPERGRATGPPRGARTFTTRWSSSSTRRSGACRWRSRSRASSPARPAARPAGPAAGRPSPARSARDVPCASVFIAIGRWPRGAGPAAGRAGDCRRPAPAAVAAARGRDRAGSRSRSRRASTPARRLGSAARGTRRRPRAGGGT